jgi:hypothetical protein
MIEPSATSPARMFTTWDTVLFVDPASGELRHGAIETSPQNAVLTAYHTGRRSGRRGWIVHTTDGVSGGDCERHSPATSEVVA